jgi:uncharacterized protein (TIGR02271 family)
VNGGCPPAENDRADRPGFNRTAAWLALANCGQIVGIAAETKGTRVDNMGWSDTLIGQQQMKVEEKTIPLVEERAIVSKRVVPKGRVQVSARVEQREEIVEADLMHEEVEIDRVPVGIEVDSVPPVRQEGDITIVPVVEEVLVVEKRLVVVEEIRLRRTRRMQHHSQPVVLAAQRAEIVRNETSGEASTNSL